MHLWGLLKLGCVSKSELGYYTVTDTGEEAIGIPMTDKALAGRVLVKTLPEKAFHFYAGIDKPTEISSDSLIDFCEKIKTVRIESIEFHMARRDFEMWIHSLGDLELAKRLRTISREGLGGEALRERLYEAVRARCDELLKK